MLDHSHAQPCRVLACALVALFAGCVMPDATSGDDDDDVAFASEDALALRPDGQRPALVRIRTIDMERDNEWTLVKPGTATVEYDAQDVLGMIGDLEPDVLERYTSGDITSFSFAGKRTVPGSALTAPGFLRASERATTCHARITPRVSLSDYHDEDGGASFFAMTKNLLELDVGPHAMRQVSLDIWNKFASASHRVNGQVYEAWSREFLVGIFNRLHAQGWKAVGINLCGTGDEPLEHLDVWGHADFADVCVSPTRTWDANGGPAWAPGHHLEQLDDSKSIRRRIVYIDFPDPMEKFQSLTADQQALALTRLAEHQADRRYTFMYPILQLEPTSDQPPQSQPGEPGGTRWDATKIHTTANSQWNGRSLYHVMRQLIRKYNTPDQACR